MEDKLKGLNRFNLFIAGMHFLQAVAVEVFSSPDKVVVPITISFLKFDPVAIKLLPSTEILFEVNLA